MNYIPRRLGWTDRALKRQSIEEADLLDHFSGPLIILGDPGMGKTKLMQQFGGRKGHVFVSAVSLLRKPDGHEFGNHRLIIDGLDEVAALNEGDPLNNVLKKLLACGKPSFVISCRSAEWRGKTAEIDIAEEYGTEPILLDIEPVSEDEAVAYLAGGSSEQRARAAVAELQRNGLKGFYENPLYLDFVAAIVSGEEELPRTRAALYERAVSRLATEQNLRHQGRGIDVLSMEGALDTAGLLAASMLMTGKSGIALSNDDDGYLRAKDIQNFADATTIKAVLKSNLFKATNSRTGHFLPLHRTVAEFLGARWLARHADSQAANTQAQRMLIRRIDGLIAEENGVPASLRGLHAWLPKFSPALLGPTAIARDPYGILLYGDGDGLTPQQAGHLIEALRQQSEFDPHFRSGWGWRSNEALTGLAQPALREQVQQIITGNEDSVAFRSLFLKALIGSTLVTDLHDDLQTIMLDCKRSYLERRDAGEAIAALPEGIIDWRKALNTLVTMGDQDSTRLAVELLDDIGFEMLDDTQIARIVLADFRLTETERHRLTVGTFFHLQSHFPHARISGLLDAMSAQLLPLLDPSKWWGGGYDEGWSEFCRLVFNLIVRKIDACDKDITGEKLWNWLRMTVYGSSSNTDQRKAISEYLKYNDAIRQKMHDIATDKLRDEDGSFEGFFRLNYMSDGLNLTDEDALRLLKRVVEQRKAADRELWYSLVSHFRGDDGMIPVPIRKIARPYAKGHQKLREYLTRKPKRRVLEDWEKKYNRRDREYKRREAQNREQMRADYRANLDKVRAGELGWIKQLAEGYLNRFTNLDREAEAVRRIAEYWGDDVAEAACIGFEAVLHREDVPDADQVAQSYAESRVWNFIYPMIAGSAERWRSGRGFADLPPELVSLLAIGAEHELNHVVKGLEGLNDALREHMRTRTGHYEAHIRRQFEPDLAAGNEHVTGLYRFTRTQEEMPLSLALCVEWLERFAQLNDYPANQLVDCILHAPEEERQPFEGRLIALAEERLQTAEPESDMHKMWLAVLFALDLDAALHRIPVIDSANRDWIWVVSRFIYGRRGDSDALVTASLQQLRFLVTTFRSLFPYTARPDGVTSGTKNSWDATQLLEWAVYQIGKDPSDEAAALLRELREAHADGYTTTIQASIAAQWQARLEVNFATPSLEAFTSVMSGNCPPRSPADMQAIILAELEHLQHRLRGDPLNAVNNFYTDAGKPRDENACRDQMLIAMGGNLPFGIQAPPEAAMPQGKRSDGAFTIGNMIVPMECKGQWHKDVWTAAETQLDRYYAINHQAARKGIYIVFWFGPDAPPGRRLKPPPAGLPKPTSPREMQRALEALLPTERRGNIAIVVLDLMRP